uniref:LysM peptidoglycan-binding domain-containing protein n=1 Tax=candidate division CPR3 bacterium TaxID=2268181 RepID=A0A7V3JAP3_UNCC3
MPQTITIPRGATLSGLARQYGTTVAELLRLNPQIRDPNKIYAGQKLTVPSAPAAPAPAGGAVGQIGTWYDPTTEQGYSGPKRKATDVPASPVTGQPITPTPTPAPTGSTREEQITEVQRQIAETQRRLEKAQADYAIIQQAQQAGMPVTPQTTVEQAQQYLASKEQQTGDPVLDQILTLLQKQTQPLSVDLITQFLKQAEQEVDPYYKTQLALAREEFLRQLGYSKEEILRQEEELERQYGKQLRTIGEEMAEKGFALSGPRLLEERELAETTQRQIEQARRSAQFAAGTAARTFAQQWGYPETTIPTISATPRVLAGEPTFERPAGEIPFYEISPEVYSGLVGEKEWEKKGEIKRRAAELEQIYRGFGEAGLRTLTV